MFQHSLSSLALQIRASSAIRVSQQLPPSPASPLFTASIKEEQMPQDNCARHSSFGPLTLRQPIIIFLQRRSTLRRRRKLFTSRRQASMRQSQLTSSTRCKPRRRPKTTIPQRWARKMQLALKVPINRLNRHQLPSTQNNSRLSTRQKCANSGKQPATASTKIRARLLTATTNSSKRRTCPKTTKRSCANASTSKCTAPTALAANSCTMSPSSSSSCNKWPRKTLLS